MDDRIDALGLDFAGGAATRITYTPTAEAMGMTSGILAAAIGEERIVRCPACGVLLHQFSAHGERTPQECHCPACGKITPFDFLEDFQEGATHGR